MRGRVDKVSLSNSDEEEEESAKEEIFVDMTETGEYVGEGEFTILGTKEEDFEKPREKDKRYENDKTVNLREIKSLEDELNLFDESEDDQELIKPKIPAKETKTEIESPELNKTEEVPAIEFNTEKDLDEIEISDTEIQKEKETPENTTIKKTKLKFGFKEDE